MPKYIVSQPSIALCIESRSSRLPTTTSAPMSRNACARSSSFRTIARTALPCVNSSSVTVRPTAPTRPAAPVTRMGFSMFLLLCGPCKNAAAYRTVLLADAEGKEELSVLKRFLKGPHHPQSVVFRSKRGSPLRETYVLHDILHPALKALGLLK